MSKKHRQNLIGTISIDALMTNWRMAKYQTTDPFFRSLLMAECALMADRMSFLHPYECGLILDEWMNIIYPERNT